MKLSHIAVDSRMAMCDYFTHEPPIAESKRTRGAPHSLGARGIKAGGDAGAVWVADRKCHPAFGARQPRGQAEHHPPLAGEGVLLCGRIPMKMWIWSGMEFICSILCLFS